MHHRSHDGSLPPGEGGLQRMGGRHPGDCADPPPLDIPGIRSTKGLECILVHFTTTPPNPTP